METIIQNTRLKAVCSWLPEGSLELSSLAEQYGEAEVVNIIRATGIERVRIADSDMTSSDMCYNAAKALIEKENIDSAEIDGLVFVSQTCDYILPSTSVSLQHRLKLPKTTICIDIHYGCSGYIYGLFQAAMWIACGACSNVLVLAGDTTSRMINQNDKSLRMVFGDCGTASLLCKGTRPMGFHINSGGSGADRLIIPAGGFRLPASEATSMLTWDAEHNGRTLNDLYMDGITIFNFAIANVPDNIERLLKMMEWDKESVGLYALHQANKFMVHYICKKLKISEELAPMNVLNYGNTGPATIPLLLCDICTEKKTNLEHVVMSGFGVGLSWGSIAASFVDTHFYEPINK